MAYNFGAMRPYIASGPDLVRPFRSDTIPQVRMSIVQPKTSKPIRYQDVSASYVVEFVDNLTTAAYATDATDAPLIADDKGGKGYCTWCKHKNACTAQSEKSIQTISETVNIQELLSQSVDQITKLDNETLAKVADAEPGLMQLFDSAKEEIQKRIEDGQDFNGYAMMPGNMTKKYAKSEEDIIKALKARKFTKDEYYPPKLISPAQVLKSKKLNDKQKARFLKDYIIEKSSGSSLKRVAYKKAKDVKTLFADVSFVEPSNNDLQCDTDSVVSQPNDLVTFI